MAEPEPFPLQPQGGADVRPEDGPQDFDLDDLDDQASEVDALIEGGEA